MQVEKNDRLNAELIMKSKKNADIIIKSIDFWGILFVPSQAQLPKESIITFEVI